MSWNRTARASKTAAASHISAMLAAHGQPTSKPTLEAKISPSESSEPARFWLRFKRDVWNSYTPSAASPASVSASETPRPLPKSRSGQKRKRIPSPVTTGDEPALKAPKRSPVQRQCKVKLTRFHYGGPDRRERGKYRDLITLSTPCLQATCANCRRRHGYVKHTGGVPSLPEPSTARQNREHYTAPPAVSSAPLRDAPRPRLTLNLRSTTPAPPADPYPASPHTEPTAAARLKFRSDKGKSRFRALVHMQVRKEIRMERERLRRVTEEAVRQALLQGEGGGGRRPQRRYRLKLAFRSEAGKAEYRRVAERYLR
jgi:hypothetical protein